MVTAVKQTYQIIPYQKRQKRRASVPDYAQITAQVNAIAAGAGHKVGLAVSDVQTVYSHFNWCCSECSERHTADNPVSLQHVFRLGIGRAGKHSTSNLKTKCQKCSRKDTPTWNTSNSHLAAFLFSGGLQAAA